MTVTSAIELRPRTRFVESPRCSGLVREDRWFRVRLRCIHWPARSSPLNSNVAITVRAADKIVAAARRINQRTRRELQWVRHVAPGISEDPPAPARSRVVEVFGFCVFRSTDSEVTVTSPRMDWMLRVKFTGCVRPRAAVTALCRWVRNCGAETATAYVRAELRESIPARVIRLQISRLAVLFADHSHVRAGDPSTGLIGHKSGDRARGFSLCEYCLRNLETETGQKDYSPKFRHD